MKTYSWLIFILTSLTANAQTQVSEDSARQRADSLKTAYVRTTPFNTSRNLNTLGYYTGHVDVARTFGTYSGVTVANVLRGRMPGLAMSSAIPFATAGIRSGGSMLVIDGVPFQPAFSQYYNLNAFEFDNITAAGTPAAGLLYGGGSGNGTIFLNNKTGENQHTPEWVFNSYATLNNTMNSSLPAAEFSERLLFSNALSFQQDFGAIDTRASYDFTSYAPNSDFDTGHSRQHKLKINAGAHLGKRFDTRIILDYVASDVLNRWSNPLTSSTRTAERKFGLTQANLFMQYHIAKGLKLTSRHAITRLSQSTKSESQNDTADQDKNFHNLFLTGEKAVLPGIQAGAFAGVQIENSTFDFTYDAVVMPGQVFASHSKIELLNESLLAGINFSIKNWLFVGSEFRSDYPSLYPSGINFYSGSVHASFVFTNAFKWDSRGFSIGRLRASYADTDFGSMNAYPSYGDMEEWRRKTSVFPATGLEFGTDLAFFDNRLCFSSTWFRDRRSTTINTSIPGTGGVVVIVDAGKIQSDGWELSLVSEPVRLDKKRRLTTTLLWWTRNDYIVELPWSTGSEYSHDLFGGPYPNWKAGMLNELQWKNFFSNVFVDFVRQEQFTFQGGLVSEIYKRAGLADVSVGILIPRPVRGSRFNNARFSLSGRNLITVYEENHDSFGNFPVIFSKSISAAVSVAF